MNELIKLYRDIERVLLNFAELNCDCGGKHKPDPADHAEYCPYWQAFEKEKQS
jgi:hypothetical protein